MVLFFPINITILHASLVSAQEVLAVRALVSDRVQRLNTAWDAGAGPQSRKQKKGNLLKWSVLK